MEQVKILMEQVLKVITDQMIMVLEKMVKEVADLVAAAVAAETIIIIWIIIHHQDQVCFQEQLQR